jgi:hypothetical protein
MDVVNIAAVISNKKHTHPYSKAAATWLHSNKPLAHPQLEL